MKLNNPVDRRVVRLAIPALGALAVEPAYVLVDTAIVGRLGTEQLAGLAIAATLLSFVFAGSNFLTYGTTERVARRIGAGRRAEAATVGVQAMWISVLVGLAAAPLLAMFSGPLCELLGASGAVHEHATTYLSISAIGVPFFLITLAAQGVLRGESDYITPLRILVTSNVANLVIELVFVFVLDMGVAGSAWSTVLSQFGAAVAFGFLLRRRLVDAPEWRPVWAEMQPLLSAGRHLLLRVGSMIAVFAGATAVAARIDAPTLAAHQIGSSLFMFTALALDALAVPAQTIVAEDLGRDDRDMASYVARRAVRLSVGTGVVLGVVMLALAPALPHAFSSDPDVTSRATSALLWLAAMMVPGAVAFAHDGILIGAADYRFLGRAALAYLVAVLPVGVVTLANPQLGIAGIWGGLMLWMLIRAVVNDRRTATVVHLRRGRRNRGPETPGHVGR